MWDWGEVQDARLRERLQRAEDRRHQKLIADSSKLKGKIKGEI